MRTALLFAAVAGCLCVPRAAPAAIVEVVDDDNPHGGPYVQFTGGPGEANRVTVVAQHGGLRIRDDGAPLRVGLRCEQISTNEAVCDPPDLIATLGDRDDTLTTAKRVVALGGDGDDTLTTGGVLEGGLGDDVLTAGPKQDDLDGGGGEDVLRAGAGDDYVEDGDGPETGVGPDRIDGGAGADLLSLVPRAAPVQVDLRSTGGQGEQGEGDAYTGIESVRARAPAVELIGNARPNELSGSGGPVDLDGRAGNDTLDAYDGIPHRLRGGLGNDVIALYGGPLNEPGELSCGPGRDRLDYPDPLQIVPPGCESVAFFDSDPYYELRGRLRSPHAAFAAAASGLCSAWRDTPCRTIWAARQANGKLAGTGPYVAKRVQLTRPGADGTQVDLRLTRYGRRLLRRRHTVLVRVGAVRRGRLRDSFVMRLTLLAKP
jgi:hemolysin type calcium-binding protein